MMNMKCNDPWYCLVCNLSDNLDRVPLTQCNNTELSYVNQNNSMNFLESLTKANIVSESMKYMSSNEINLEIPTLDIKVMNIFQRDYSSFTNESFRDDISIQKWNYSYNKVQDLFNDFYDGCVNRHAPLKKVIAKRDQGQIQTLDKW